PPIGKHKLEWTDHEGRKHAVELLGAKCQYVIFGPHKSGALNEWRDGKGPWDRVALIPEITADAIRLYFAELRAHVEANGGKVSEKSGKAAANDNASAVRGDEAPSKEALSDLMAHMQKGFLNNDENVPTRNDFIPFAAAMIVAAGEHWLEIRPEFMDWACDGYPNPPEWVEQILESNLNTDK